MSLRVILLTTLPTRRGRHPGRDGGPEMSNLSTAFNRDKAQALLGVAGDARDKELQAAYLAKVRQHPPDRDPELFEQIRDAYDQLRNPATRARMVLEGPDPFAPLTSLLDNAKVKREYVGS